MQDLFVLTFVAHIMAPAGAQCPTGGELVRNSRVGDEGLSMKTDKAHSGGEETSRDPANSRAVSPGSRSSVLYLLFAIGTALLIFGYQESLAYLVPGLGVVGVDALTSIFTGVLAALGVTFVLRRHQRFSHQVNLATIEQQQLEQIKTALTAQTERLSVINQSLQGQITYVQQAEVALRSSESELRALLAAMTDVFLVLNEEGRYIRIAPTNPALLYKPSDAILGKTLHEIFPNAQADQFLGYIRFALVSRRTVNTEYALLIAAEEVWFAAAISPLGEDSVIWVARDISERKRVELQLAEEKEITSALAKIGQEMITVLDTPDILERLCRVTAEALQCDCSHTLLWELQDKAFAFVAGYGDTPEQWETLRILRIPHSELLDFLSLLDQHTVVETDLSQQQNLPLPAAAALQFGTSIVLCIALRRGGNLIGIQVLSYRHRPGVFSSSHKRIALGIAQIASLALNNAQLLEEVKTANQFKSDFLATISHELRTPLSVVRGYVSLLSEEFASELPDEAKTMLRRVQRAALEETELVSALVNVSRLEAGKILIETQEVHLPRLIDEIRTEMASTYEQSGLAFEWVCPTVLRPIVTDRLKLKIVLKNLIENAIKFTHEGRVMVSVSPRDDGVELCVTDTGVGISPEVLPHIFDLFHQGDSSTTRRYEGVGLGLYIVQRMVELLKGTVTVESTENQGSTFRVWLPQRLQPPDTVQR